ncbi:4834_t:CDS:2, partial [Acaulospora morrowiae]
MIGWVPLDFRENKNWKCVKESHCKTSNHSYLSRNKMQYDSPLDPDATQDYFTQNPSYTSISYNQNTPMETSNYNSYTPGISTEARNFHTFVPTTPMEMSNFNPFSHTTPFDSNELLRALQKK